MVAIVIVVYNLDSRIFLLQQEAIKKFCTDEYEVQIIDNSSDENLAEAIRYHCELSGLNYIKTYAGGKGSLSHSFAAQFAYNKFKNDYQYFCFLDHDLLPVKTYSVVELLGDKIIAGLAQGINKTYYWPGVVMWNADKMDRDMVDFSPSPDFGGLDTGGNLYKIIDLYDKKNCVFFNQTYHQNELFTGIAYNVYDMINNQMFMHFVNASAWCHIDKQEERINSLLNIAKEKAGL